MEMDSTLLLTAETLYLDPGVIRGLPVNGVFCLKRVASQTYLSVNAAQARVLDEFKHPITVPQVLENCIRDRTCIALREFYELVLQAHEAGILRSEELGSEGPPVAIRLPKRWFVSLGPRGVVALAFFAAVATASIFTITPAVNLRRPIEYFYGWLAICGSLSFGQALAACALRGAGCEVHNPRFKWTTLVPHFAIDARDACMGDRFGQAAVAGISVLPLSLSAAVGLWLNAGWGMLPLAALFVACRPIGDTPISHLLQLFRRMPLVATDTPRLFVGRFHLNDRARLAWKCFDWHLALFQLVIAVAWALAIVRVADCLAGQDFIAAFKETNVAYWEKVGRYAVVAMAVASGLGLVSMTQYHIVDAVALNWSRIRTEARRWMAKRKVKQSDWDTAALIRRNPVLRRLDNETQSKLVARLRILRVRPWQTIIDFDDKSTFVGLIVSGRAVVYRRGITGRKSRFLKFSEGDFFGGHKQIDPEKNCLEVRTATPLVAFVMTLEDFEQLVVAKLGTAALWDQMSKQVFLRRSTLCSEWRSASVARFSEMAVLSKKCAAGAVVRYGQPVRSLYVLYEGRAKALRDGKQVGKIRQGEFFGEISLLQTSAATADVEASEDGRFLTVDRLDFIKFIARNYHVALQMERLCSKRLGHPLFPLDQRTFDER